MTQATWGVEPEPCPADFDGNCSVDFIDFAIFAPYWLNDCTVDLCGMVNLDEVGGVDASDLAIFAENWLCGK